MIPASSPKPKHLDMIRLGRVALWLIVITGSVAILLYFKNILQPLLIAGIIWFMVKMVKDLFRKIRIGGKEMPKAVRNVLSLVLILLVLWFIGDILISNLNNLISRLPHYEMEQEKMIQDVISFLGFADFGALLESLPRSQQIRPLLNGLLNGVTGALGNAFIVILYTVFMLIEETSFLEKLKKIKRKSSTFRSTAEMVDYLGAIIRNYIGVKTMMSLLTGALSFVVLRIMGVDYPVLWAFLIFLLNFIPYIGSLIATLMPAVFAALQFGSLWTLLLVFGVLQIPQFLVANIIEPRVMGRTLNLSPLIVLITLTIWAKIWGGLGMIIAVPITSITVLIMAQFRDTRFLAVLLSGTGSVDRIIAEKPVDLSPDENVPEKEAST